MPVPPGPGGARHASRGTWLPQLTVCMPSGRASHHHKDNTVSGDGWRSKAVSRLPQLLLILNGSTRRRRQSVSESPEDRRTDNADKEVDERLQQLPCSPTTTPRVRGTAPSPPLLRWWAAGGGSPNTGYAACAVWRPASLPDAAQCVPHCLCGPNSRERGLDPFD